MTDGTPAQHHAPPSRGLYLAANALAFGLLYNATNLAAQRAGTRRSWAMDWEHQLPFLDWAIAVYMTSVPLLLLAFVRVPAGQPLRALAQRCLLATVLACLVFALWPARFAWPRPADLALPWAWLYAALDAMDQPFNQFPSLHVAYAVLAGRALWQGRRSRAGGVLTTLWAGAVAASTLFTHQHHSADLLGGLALAALCLWVVPARRETPWVAFYYGCAAAAAAVLGLTLAPAWPMAYLALSLGAVALAYARGWAGFTGKRQGRLPWLQRLLLAPYLLGYALSWQAVRWRERHRPPFLALAPRLLVGRRLSDAEARMLPAGCQVVDLCNELDETPALRGPGHQHVPLLDLIPPDAGQRQRVHQAIDRALARGPVVYLHCAMGYARSVQMARDYLASRPSTETPS